VAEEITSRFFNVISLFNQSIPIIALKLTALKLGDQYGVIFTKILNYERKGIETDEDNQTTTREVWIKRSATPTMAIADQILTIAKELSPGFEFRYAKNYITMKLEGKGRTFVYLIPQKKELKIWVTLKAAPELDKLCENEELDVKYNDYYNGYQFDLRPGDVETHRDFFKDFIGRLYKAGTD
jgi:predicted transport protein